MRNILFIVILVALCSACSNELMQSEYRATDSGAWDRNDIFEFTIAQLDTLQSYNVFINLRHNADYPYSNLFLIAELEAPSGQTIKDTLQYQMALPDGTWLGKGYGSIKENKLWYKDDFIFSQTGTYTLRLSQAMRKNGSVNGVVSLEGITDVGFAIEKPSPIK